MYTLIPPRRLLIVWLGLLPFSLAPRDKDGDGIAALSAVKQAMGGSRWDATRTLHAEGHIQIGELQGTYETWMDLRTLRSYVDMRFSHPALGALRSTAGWNGSLSWSADQTGDVCIAASRSALRDAAQNAYVEAFAYLLKNRPPVSVIRERDRSLDRQRFQVLRITPPESSPFELWAARDTGRITRIVPLAGVDRDVMTYRDFRMTDGLLLPFRVEEREARSGTYSAVRTASRLEVDREPPAHLFDPPPPVRSGLQFPAGRDSVTMPFRLDDGHIYLPVSINGRRLDYFVFDTGATNTIEQSRAGSLGLTVVRAGAAYGGGTNAVENGLARVEHLEIGGLEMDNQVLDVTPLPQEDVPINGILGYELAERSVVTLDYALDRITFTKPESFHPPADADGLPIRFASTSEIVVEGSVDGIAGEFQLDTGQGTALLINRPFAERNGLLRRYGSGRKGLVSGVGGHAGLVLFSPADFAMGSLKPAVPEAGIMLSRSGGGAEEELAGTIGNPILRQYRVTLDYARGMAYFEKNPNYRGGRDETFKLLPPDPRKRPRGTTVGLVRLRRESGGPLEILELTAAGPAARAGIETGDWILAINGTPVDHMTVTQIFTPITAPAGTVVTLTIRHGEATREVILTIE